LGLTASAATNASGFKSVDETPEGIERVAQIWREMMLPEDPVMKDVDSGWLSSQSWRVYDGSHGGPRKFVQSPEVQARAAEGRKFFAEFEHEAEAEIAKKHPELVLSIPKRIQESFEDLLRAQNGHAQRAIKQLEAERTVREEMLRENPRLRSIESDSAVREDYSRRVYQRTLKESLQTKSALAKRDFEAWRAQTLRKLAEWRLTNARFLLEASFENLAQSVYFLAGTAPGETFPSYGDFQTSALTRADLDRMTLEYRPSAPSLRTGSRTPEYFLRAADGALYALGKDPSSKFVFTPADLASAARNDSRLAAQRGTPEFELNFYAWTEAGAAATRAEIYENVIQKLRWEPKSEGIRAQLHSALKGAEAKSPTGYRNHALGTMGSTWVPELFDLYWWGIGQKREIQRWINRDTVAAARGMPSSFAVFKGSASPGEVHQPESEREAFAFKNKNPKPHNKLPPPGESILQVRNLGLFEKSPDFLYLPSNEALADVSRHVRVALPRHPKGISLALESLQTLSAPNDQIAIPVAEDFELRAFKLMDTKGEVLRRGRDYRLYRIENEPGLFAQVIGRDRLDQFHYSASFGRREAMDPVKSLKHGSLERLDPARLEALAGELRQAGLTAVATEIVFVLRNMRDAGLPISVADLAHIFRTTGLYSYVRERPHAPDAGRFTGYSGFANAEGVACFQCDGANELFSDFLNAYFQAGPSPSRYEARGANGFGVGSGGIISPKNFHRVTTLRRNGVFFRKLDVTPMRMDPRNSDLSPEERPALELKSEEKPSGDSIRTFAWEVEQKKKALIRDYEAVFAGRTPSPREPFSKTIQLATLLQEHIAGRLSLPRLREKLGILLTIENLPRGGFLPLAVHWQASLEESAQAIERYRTKARRSTHAGKYPEYEAPYAVEQLLAFMRWLTVEAQTLQSRDFADYWRAEGFRPLPVSQRREGRENAHRPRPHSHLK
jgi:hypothetical protein